MLNRASNYSVIPNANERYTAMQSSPTPAPCASLPSGRRFNKVPARLRQTSRALDHPHVDATTSYQTASNHGYHYHHGHRSNQYQKEKAYKNKYKYKYKYKYKATKRPKNVPAAEHMAQSSENSGSDSDGTGEKDASQNATGSNKSMFGLRKVSRIIEIISLCPSMLTSDRHATSTFSYPRAARLGPHQA